LILLCDSALAVLQKHLRLVLQHDGGTVAEFRMSRPTTDSAQHERDHQKAYMSQQAPRIAACRLTNSSQWLQRWLVLLQGQRDPTCISLLVSAIKQPLNSYKPFAAGFLERSNSAVHTAKSSMLSLV